MDSRKVENKKTENKKQKTKGPQVTLQPLSNLVGRA